MAGYQMSTPIDCEKALDTSNLKGKTAIVTGGKLTLVQDINRIWRVHRRKWNWWGICEGTLCCGVSALGIAWKVQPRWLFQKCQCMHWGHGLRQRYQTSIKSGKVSLVTKSDFTFDADIFEVQNSWNVMYRNGTTRFDYSLKLHLSLEW